MEQNDFYVTLCSNVINERDVNTIANFVTRLPAPLQLDSSWRVGLSEVHFTNSWVNLREDCRLRIKLAFADALDEDFTTYTYLPAGRYDDIAQLLSAIDTRLAGTVKPTVKDMPKFMVDNWNRRISLKYGYTTSMQPLMIMVGPELEDLLGLSEGYASSYAHKIIMLEDEVIDINPDTSADEIFTANRPYDLTGGIHSLFVYCDIVDYSIVGDSRVQLLRLAHIPADSSFGDAVIDRYENPHYLPLATKDISSIEVHIKDDSDTTIGFAFGRVKLVLHFVKHG